MTGFMPRKPRLVGGELHFAPKTLPLMKAPRICHYTIYFLPTLKFLYRIKIKNDIKNNF